MESGATVHAKVFVRHATHVAETLQAGLRTSAMSPLSPLWCEMRIARSLASRWRRRNGERSVPGATQSAVGLLTHARANSGQRAGDGPLTCPGSSVLSPPGVEKMSPRKTGLAML